jgi:cytochrome P450
LKVENEDNKTTIYFLLSEIDGDKFVGQAFAFLVAGFETSGTTLSYALYELALHSEIQQRLRAEITQVLDKHHGELTYDGIREMSYLDMVVKGERIEIVYVLWIVML